ncbi:MAG: hypothetical protein Q4D29_00260 [Lachnospiraceae bacterium]|nr:hypothetical protein [Lachnospiraceae bacterium]
MKNVRFVIKCILALLPVLAVVLYTAVVPFGYMDSEFPAWKYTKDTVCDSSANTVILGDSRAMADLIPEMFEVNTVNLSVGGATSIEMYYTLKKYIENNGQPENVIIMFAPFHYSVIDNFWTRTAYFNYLSVKDMTDLYSYAEATGSETLLCKGYKNDLLSYRLRFPDKYLPALMNSKIVGRYNENVETYKQIKENLGYGEFGTADGCSDLNYETSYEEMHTTADAVLLDLYLNKLLKLCVDNKINTTLAIPPMNQSSYEALNPSYVDELHFYFVGLSHNYPGIIINDEIPMYEDMYFGDSSHLNHSGAVKFTEEFIHFLLSIS